MNSETLLKEATARFDAINAADPNRMDVAGRLRPRELVQAERLEAWVYRVVDEPSLALRLAARCQHLARFELPRSHYPEGRVGYLSWRKELSRRHTEKACAVLEELGAPADLIAAVRAITSKQNLRGNPDGQAMEDALCLAFLEHEFVPFIERWDDDTVVGIVQKTWLKMSEHGRELAKTLVLEGRARQLVERALSA
jgi:hypothetical protein